MAIKANENAASSAGPVVVEEGGLADVAHLSYVPDSSLPRDASNLRLLTVMHRDALPFLPDHVAELVSNQAEDELGLLDVVVRRLFRSGHPNVDVVLGVTLSRIAVRVEVADDADMTGLGAAKLPEGEEGAADVDVVVDALVVGAALQDGRQP